VLQTGTTTTYHERKPGTGRDLLDLLDALGE
jgi:hypothetical protein